MSVVWDKLTDIKSQKASIAAVWLDIANAYGSIPHQLIFLALKRYGVHSLWIDLIKAYYSGIWSKSFSPNAPSSWHQHFRGIFTGCTISIILFLSGMNIVLEYIVATKIMTDALLSPSVRAFMDDLYVMTSSFENTQILLNRAAKALSWARMSLKAAKSRSLVVTNGKVENEKVYIVNVNVDVILRRTRLVSQID